MDYNNHLSPYSQIDYDDKMYDNMTDEEKMKAGCLHLFIVILMSFIGIIVCLLLGSCTTTKYVTVPEIHDQHHWHTDSIHQTDSIIKENTTTIMQLDSSAMAEYGIRLKGAEREWLVKTAELERQIQKLAKLTQEFCARLDTDTRSNPYRSQSTRRAFALAIVPNDYWQHCVVPDSCCLWILHIKENQVVRLMIAVRRSPSFFKFNIV